MFLSKKKESLKRLKNKKNLDPRYLGRQDAYLSTVRYRDIIRAPSFTRVVRCFTPSKHIFKGNIEPTTCLFRSILQDAYLN